MAELKNVFFAIVVRMHFISFLVFTDRFFVKYFPVDRNFQSRIKLKINILTKLI